MWPGYLLEMSDPPTIWKNFTGPIRLFTGRSLRNVNWGLFGLSPNKIERGRRCRILGCHGLYSRLLKLSTALPCEELQSPESLDSTPPWRPDKLGDRSLSPSLTYQGALLGLGDPETVTNPTIHTGCYPGAGRSLPIRSKIPSNTSLVTNTAASWNTSLLAWRTRRPPILISLVCTLRSDQCFTVSGRASLLKKFPRL